MNEMNLAQKGSRKKSVGDKVAWAVIILVVIMAGAVFVAPIFLSGST